MKKEQRSKKAMFTAVKKFFIKYQTIIDSVPALKDGVEKFLGINEEIDKVILVQEGKITGSSKDKQKEEQEMIDATIRIAAGLYVMALDNSNFEVMEKVDLSPSALGGLPETDLLSACKNVLKLARENQEGIVNYGIVAEDVDNLDAEIGDFEAVLANPRTEIVTRSQATAKLKELIKSEMDLLNQKLDKLILMFKQSETVFYNEYKSARIIVNLGVRHHTEAESEAL